jgi:hypothetical protein
VAAAARSTAILTTSDFWIMGASREDEVALDCRQCPLAQWRSENCTV